MGLTISQSKVQSMRREKSSARKNPPSDRHDKSGVDIKEFKLNDQIENVGYPKRNHNQQERQMPRSKQKGLSASKKSFKQGGMYNRNSSQLFPSIVINQPRKSPKKGAEKLQQQINQAKFPAEKEEKESKIMSNTSKQQKENNMRNSSHKQQAPNSKTSKTMPNDLKQSAYPMKNQQKLTNNKQDDQQSLFKIDERYDLLNSRRPKQNEFSLLKRQSKISNERQSYYQNKPAVEKVIENVENQGKSQFQKTYQKYDWTIPKLYQQVQGSAKKKLKPSPSNLVLAKSRNIQLSNAEQEDKKLNWNNRRQIMTQIALDRLKTADRYPLLTICVSEQKKNQIIQNFCS